MKIGSILLLTFSKWLFFNSCINYYSLWGSLSWMVRNNYQSSSGSLQSVGLLLQMGNFETRRSWRNPSFIWHDLIYWNYRNDQPTQENFSLSKCFGIRTDKRWVTLLDSIVVMTNEQNFRWRSTYRENLWQLHRRTTEDCQSVFKLFHRSKFLKS